MLTLKQTIMTGTALSLAALIGLPATAHATTETPAAATSSFSAVTFAETETTTYAEGDVVASGMWGTAEWRIVDGVFEIGAGELADIETQSGPWMGLQDQFSKIVFTDAANTIFPELSANLFLGLTNVTAIENIGDVDVSRVTNTSGMYVSLGANTAGVTDLDVGGWDVTNVDEATQMFARANLPDHFDLSGWDTGSLIYMDGMFQYANVTELNLAGWDVTNVTDMTNLFKTAGDIEALNLDGWDTSRVTDSTGMFKDESYISRITFGDDLILDGVTLTARDDALHNGEWVRLPEPGQATDLKVSTLDFSAGGSRTEAGTYVWQQNVLVDLDPRNGSDETAGVTMPTYEEMPLDVINELFTNGDRALLGWTTDPEGEEPMHIIPRNGDNLMRIYAVWAPVEEPGETDPEVVAPSEPQTPEGEQPGAGENGAEEPGTEADADSGVTADQTADAAVKLAATGLAATGAGPWAPILGIVGALGLSGLILLIARRRKKDQNEQTA